MRYQCANCGCVFDEEDAGRRTEHEEFWGAPCSIVYNVCPECGDDISDEDEYEEEEDDEEDA
jgi:rubredoxin